MPNNPFSGIGVGVAPHQYTTRHYGEELAEIARIFETELAALPVDDNTAVIDAEESGGTTPRKTLSAQRSQAMGAASKRLSRGVALRFLIDCKGQGFPMTVHLAKRLLADLFSEYGRASISEAMLVFYAGGGAKAQRNGKLDLGAVRGEIVDCGLLKKHRDLLKAAKREAEAVRDLPGLVEGAQ